MIPQEIRAGSAYEWSESISRYSSDTYSLEYTLFNSEHVFTINGESGEFRVELSSSDTSAFVSGVFQYVLRVSDGTDKYEIRSGTLRVLANVDHLQNHDGRSHARRMLDAIESTLEGRASAAADELTVGGRTIKRTPIPELLRLRGLYRQEVASEEAAAGLQSGASRVIKTRFGG